MSKVKVCVKWGKQQFTDVELDTSQPVSTFNTQLHALTGVPVERQKLMSKGVWKGMLKGDADLKSFEKLKDGAQIMLMGSAETVKVPETKTVFVEDMSMKEIAETGTVLPAGLINLGNTCYMNSTLQCLRSIPELREAITAYPGNMSSDLSHNFVVSLRETFRNLDANVDSIPPVVFVDTLRQAFPQFAQQAPRGGYMQQDSDEFLSIVFTTLAQKLLKAHGMNNLGGCSNFIEALMGLEMEEKLRCAETDDEPVVEKKETAMKLVCNINKEVNHVSEGIKVGLEGTIEKNSSILGRNAVWKKELKINRLPRYLCVQFMRFYWKATPDSRDHAGVKCKMLRPISFPMTLDVFDFCSERLKAKLGVSRDKNAEKILNEFKTKEGDEEGKKAETAEKSDAMDVDTEEAAALQAAMAMSMGEENSIGPGMPVDFQGNYELFAVVTHKGRSADSGHYMGWVRDKGDDWLCYNDDEVSPCKSEDIQNLKGGGDWHMTYLTFYRAKN